MFVRSISTSFGRCIPASFSLQVDGPTWDQIESTILKLEWGEISHSVFLTNGDMDGMTINLRPPPGPRTYDVIVQRRAGFVGAIAPQEEVLRLVRPYAERGELIPSPCWDGPLPP